MTWDELIEFAKNLEPRLRGSKVEVFDCKTGETIREVIAVKDCSADYVYDVNHPQLWINYNSDSESK